MARELTFRDLLEALQELPEDKLDQPAVVMAMGPGESDTWGIVTRVFMYDHDDEAGDDAEHNVLGAVNGIPEKVDPMEQVILVAARGQLLGPLVD